MPTLTIPPRFCGPADSGNGGWTCGALAAHVDAPGIEVTLRSPPPLETELTVERSPEAARLLDGDELVAEAAAAEAVTEDLPRPVPLDEAADAAGRFPAFEGHIFPRCFTCGPDRDEGDGLRIFAGPVAAGDQVAAPWTPHESLADEDGLVSSPHVWAALDCPGYFAGPDPMASPALLGRMAATVHRRPVPGDDLVVTGRTTGTDGRKRFATTALFTTDGELLGAARQTWIVVG